jgi:hypothetical protein
MQFKTTALSGCFSSFLHDNQLETDWKLHRFRPLLELEQQAHEDVIRNRLSTWSVDRLVEEGYRVRQMVGFWLDVTQFGRPVATFSMGPGTSLPWNRFE